MTQGHDEHSTWANHRPQARHCYSSIFVGKVLPHGAQGAEIECAVGHHCAKVWQAIIYPLCLCGGVKRLASFAQLPHRLDGKRVVSLVSKPSCISARAGSNVSNLGTPAWE